MKITELPFANSACSLDVSDLPSLVQDWLLDCEFRRVSRTTAEKYRIVLNKLNWFLSTHGNASCGKREIQQFMLYLRNGHEDEGGRWGNGRLTKPATAGTSATYFRVISTFFQYAVAEGVIGSSPLERMAKPVDRPDQVTPFTLDQVSALVEAARRSRNSVRDEAMVLFLLDTGVRASEICGLTLADVDFHDRRCNVLGKGNKRRSVFFSKDTARRLSQYVKASSADRPAAGPLFMSERRACSGEALTRSGLLQLIERLGEAAKIDAAKCSPHVFRHTFAIEFLRAGGNIFTLKELLGHTTLAVCNRYVALSQADIERQHRLYSPVERLRRRSNPRQAA